MPKIVFRNNFYFLKFILYYMFNNTYKNQSTGYDIGEFIDS